MEKKDFPCYYVGGLSVQDTVLGKRNFCQETVTRPILWPIWWPWSLEDTNSVQSHSSSKFQAPRRSRRLSHIVVGQHCSCMGRSRVSSPPGKDGNKRKQEVMLLHNFRTWWLYKFSDSTQLLWLYKSRALQHSCYISTTKLWCKYIGPLHLHGDQ